MERGGQVPALIGCSCGAVGHLLLMAIAHHLTGSPKKAYFKIGRIKFPVIFFFHLLPSPRNLGINASPSRIEKIDL